MAVIRDVMPEFELFQPATIDDAVGLLDKYGKDAWVMAGGLDTFDWLKDRIKKPKVVVDLSQVKEMVGVREKDGGIEIGAMTTLTDVVRNPIVKEKFSLLSTALKPRRHRKSAIREPSVATCRRMRAAGITEAAGNAIGLAATSASRIHRRPSTVSTLSSTPNAAWL
jgi:xanthine dehydrogenase iron-sulfur cluster and FAD-binding subunit A